MLFQVNYWTAFTAGFLSFFSPCLLPLVPAYIMYLTGSFDVDDIAKKRKKAILQTLGFILGFTIVFMILGVSASFIGKLFGQNKALLSKISGLIIIFFGLYMTGIIKLPFMLKDYRKRTERTKVTFVSSIAIGMAFAFGWTPCFGPILGAILASTAAISNNVAEGVKYLFTYSMGMAIPFLLTSVFLSFFDQKVTSLTKYSKKINIIAGIFLMVIGLLIFSDKMYIIANWLVELMG
ncbi:cytochrome c biogenesis CcdA family protein [Fusibacter bizertensis]